MLSVYALMDARVGYCQGMNEIAAFFLDNVPDESEAFWCFSTFLEAYRPHFVISGGSSSSSGSSARRGEAFEARGGSSSPGRSGTTSRRSSIDGGGEGSGVVGEKEPRPFAATVRERLGELGRILERCDPPMWKHVQLLGGSECMFAFRAVVVLLARELPPSEAEHLRSMGLKRYGGPPSAVAQADMPGADLPEACRSCTGCTNPNPTGIGPSTTGSREGLRMARVSTGPLQSLENALADAARFSLTGSTEGPSADPLEQAVTNAVLQALKDGTA